MMIKASNLTVEAMKIEEDPASSLPSVTLSPDQQARIARQKELALARRKQRTAQQLDKSWGLMPCSHAQAQNFLADKGPFCPHRDFLHNDHLASPQLASVQANCSSTGRVSVCLDRVFGSSQLAGDMEELVDAEHIKRPALGTRHHQQMKQLLDNKPQAMGAWEHHQMKQFSGSEHNKPQAVGTWEHQQMNHFVDAEHNKPRAVGTWGHQQMNQFVDIEHSKPRAVGTREHQQIKQFADVEHNKSPAGGMQEHQQMKLFADSEHNKPQAAGTWEHPQMKQFVDVERNKPQTAGMWEHPQLNQFVAVEHNKPWAAGTWEHQRMDQFVAVDDNKPRAMGTGEHPQTKQFVDVERTKPQAAGMWERQQIFRLKFELDGKQNVGPSKPCFAEGDNRCGHEVCQLGGGHEHGVKLCCHIEHSNPHAGTRAEGSCTEIAADDFQSLGESDKEDSVKLRPLSKYHDPDSLPIPKGGLMFSKQQMEVLKAVAQGKSIFMTGSAGTGKSYVISHILWLLQKRFGKESVYVTASTGLAACALGGTTLHAFGGIGLGTDDAETLAAKVLGKKEPRERWRQAQVLIIDEISMIDGELFDKLDYVARMVRDPKYKNKCFGGLQLIVTGDFFQLPPVKPPNIKKYFAFEADCWEKCINLQIELEHVFRQCDQEFVEMLKEIRKGSCSPQTQEKLKACRRVLADDGSGITPTRLYPLKVDVKAENATELRALARETFRFFAHDKASNAQQRHQLDGMRAEKELDLCVGAQVMLLKNFDTSVGLVNGARGVVVGFDSLILKENDWKQEALSVSPTNKWPVVRFVCDGYERIIGPEKQTLELGGTEVACRIQVPLALAWALSVHKCQGMTLDRMETDLSKAFEYGMVYVALSRVKNLDALQLIGFDPARVKVHPNLLVLQ